MQHVESVRAGHLDAVQFFLGNGAKYDHITPQGYSPLNLARQYLEEDHPVVKLLVDVGAVDIGPDL